MKPGLLSRARDIWKTRRDYIINGFSDVTITGLGFASSVLIARGLGPTGRGQLTAGLLWPTTIGALAGLGLPQAITYAVGARWATPRSLARFAFLFSLFVGLPAAAIYFVLAPRLLGEAFAVIPPSLRYFGAFIPLTICAGLWMALFQGKGDFATWNIAKLFRSAGYTAWIGCALLLGVTAVSPVLWSQVVLVAVILAFMALRIHRLSPNGAPMAVPTGRLFKYGLAVYASGIFYMLNQQLDQLLLSLWVPAQELGQYASAVSLSAIVMFVPSTMGPVVFSRLARSSPKEGSRHAVKAAAICCGLLLPVVLAMTFLAPWLVRLVYGPAFAPAGQVLRVLAPAAALLGLGNLFSDVLRGYGKPLIPTYAMGAGLLITIPGLAFSLSKWGMWGAAWVSLIAYGAMLAVQAGSFFYISASAREHQ